MFRLFSQSSFLCTNLKSWFRWDGLIASKNFMFVVYCSFHTGFLVGNWEDRTFSSPRQTQGWRILSGIVSFWTCLCCLYTFWDYIISIIVNYTYFSHPLCDCSAVMFHVLYIAFLKWECNRISYYCIRNVWLVLVRWCSRLSIYYIRALVSPPMRTLLWM